MLAYFLKVNVAIALLYAFYRLFFYKDTFFGWRRAALIGVFVAAAVTPLLDIQTWIAEQDPMVAMAGLYASIVLPEFTITPDKGITYWENAIRNFTLLAYAAGVLFLGIRFLLQLASIIRLAHRCRSIRMGSACIHLLPQEEGPFSFFHWIFIHPSSHTEEEFSEILAHEQAHVRQWHSIDVIVGELACALCWFNPFAWLMKREIRTNLEYMADERVLENGYDSKTYQYHLLGLSHHKAAATLYNNFNVLTLKKRIQMMNKKRSKGIGKAKYLTFIPLTALLMLAANIEATTPPLNEPLLEEVVFEVAEVAPEFPYGGKNGLIAYLEEQLRYPAEAHAAGTQGRVIVQFIVNTDGSISDVHTIRKVDPLLDQEAIRVISNMPGWKPGMQRGKVVRTRCTVPVQFKLQ